MKIASIRGSVKGVKSIVTGMLVSGDDRHVICFGTETTIGSTNTQDNMFIRWSDQEQQNVGVKGQ